jgi:hypothetical protein
VLQGFAVRTGLEPATSCVTGRHSNQLNYRTFFRMECKDSPTALLSKKMFKTFRIYHFSRANTILSEFEKWYKSTMLFYGRLDFNELILSDKIKQP